jgi:hypothetical protein
VVNLGDLLNKVKANRWQKNKQANRWQKNKQANH